MGILLSGDNFFRKFSVLNQFTMKQQPSVINVHFEKKNSFVRVGIRALSPLLPIYCSSC